MRMTNARPSGHREKRSWGTATGFGKRVLLVALAAFVTAWPVSGFGDTGKIEKKVEPRAEQKAELQNASIQKVEPQGVAPKAEAKADEAASYAYNPKGKIDPFKPFLNLEVAKVGVNKPKKAVPRTPLMEFGLDQIKMTGIAHGSEKRVAMIEDPKGKGYIISEGTLLGHNGGRVVQILPDRMVVEEKVMDAKGKNKTQRIVIKLHKDEREGRL